MFEPETQHGGPHVSERQCRLALLCEKWTVHAATATLASAQAYASAVKRDPFLRSGRETGEAEGQNSTSAATPIGPFDQCCRPDRAFIGPFRFNTFEIATLVFPATAAAGQVRHSSTLNTAAATVR